MLQNIQAIYFFKYSATGVGVFTRGAQFIKSSGPLLKDDVMKCFGFFEPRQWRLVVANWRQFLIAWRLILLCVALTCTKTISCNLAVETNSLLVNRISDVICCEKRNAQKVSIDAEFTASISGVYLFFYYLNLLRYMPGYAEKGKNAIEFEREAWQMRAFTHYATETTLLICYDLLFDSR